MDFWFEWTLACLAAAALQYFMFFIWLWTLFAARRSHPIVSDFFCRALFHCLPCYGAWIEAMALNELQCGELNKVWSSNVVLYHLCTGVLEFYCLFFEVGYVFRTAFRAWCLNTLHWIYRDIYNDCAALGIICYPRYSISQKWVHPSHFCKYFIISFHVTTLKKWHFARM